MARCHVPEPTHPYEAVGPVEVAEVTGDDGAHLLLGLDEFPLEQGDEGVRLPGEQGVLAELEDSTEPTILLLAALPLLAHRRQSLGESRTAGQAWTANPRLTSSRRERARSGPI